MRLYDYGISSRSYPSLRTVPTASQAPKSVTSYLTPSKHPWRRLRLARRVAARYPSSAIFSPSRAHKIGEPLHTRAPHRITSPVQSTQQFSITFDALLVGHEASVTSLSWRPLPPSSSSSAAAFDRTPTLLSTSTDSSLILWSPSTILTSTSAQENGQDGTTSLWINRQRFGDVGGQRLGGFVGGLWTRGGAEASAWGWSGGWRRWRCIPDAGSHDGGLFGAPSLESWTETGAISGHNGPVRGISWSPDGEYLLSAR